MDSPEITASIFSKKEDIRFIGHEIAERILGQEAIARALDMEEIEYRTGMALTKEEWSQHTDLIKGNRGIDIPEHWKVIEMLAAAPIIVTNEVESINGFMLAELRREKLLMDRTKLQADGKNFTGMNFKTLVITSFLESVTLKQVSNLVEYRASSGTTARTEVTPQVSLEQVDEYLGRYNEAVRNTRQLSLPELKEKLNPYLFLSHLENKD